MNEYIYIFFFRVSSARNCNSLDDKFYEHESTRDSNCLLSGPHQFSIFWFRKIQITPFSFNKKFVFVS